MGKEASSASILAFGISRNWRERIATVLELEGQGEAYTFSTARTDRGCEDNLWGVSVLLNKERKRASSITISIVLISLGVLKGRLKIDIGI